MFNFETNIYLSKELMEDETLSLKAKCIFAYIENICAKTGRNSVFLNQKELMEVIKVKSRSTLKTVLKELEENGFITVKRNKYTLLKSYILEVI